MSSESSEQRYCCEHSARCAVHQLPFDGGYVECNCTLGIGSIRHERVASLPAGIPAATVKDLSQTAFGALIALEAGEKELAARLLTDVLVKSGQATDAAPEKDPPAE